MAVGDVVNKLPVNINIEVVADTWKDQSGKYWIGDQDPKLCFCRILRSKTVMVRVGGGWCELSKSVSPQYLVGSDAEVFAGSYKVTFQTCSACFLIRLPEWGLQKNDGLPPQRFLVLKRVLNLLRTLHEHQSLKALHVDSRAQGVEVRIQRSPHRQSMARL